MRMILMIIITIFIFSCKEKNSNYLIYQWNVCHVNENNIGLVCDSTVYDTVSIEENKKISIVKNIYLKKFHSIDISESNHFVLNKIDTSEVIFHYYKSVLYRGAEYTINCYFTNFLENIHDEVYKREIKFYLNSKFGIYAIQYREHYPEVYLLQKIVKANGQKKEIIIDISDFPLDAISHEGGCDKKGNVLYGD